MPRKPKKIKLTAAEQKILTYPPNEGTWVCTSVRTLQNEETFVCNTYNAERVDKCVLCGTAKSKKPVLLWPIYLEACEKAKIVPGWKWRMKDTQFQKRSPDKDAKWEDYDPNEITILPAPKAK